MKPSSLFVFAATMFGAVVPVTLWASECHAPTPLAQMTPTFEDDFTGEKPDTTVWNLHPRSVGSINGEVQAYAPDAFEMLPGGGLRIRADKRDLGDKHFTSGTITTFGGFSQTYGHFEMKAKFPAVDGAWPAFWLLPEDGTWPPEIDVVEYIHYPWGHLPDQGNPSYAHFGVFWNPKLPSVTWQTPDNAPWNANSGIYLNNDYKIPSKRPVQINGDMTTGYHTYAVDWRPHELSFSVDGKEGMCWVESDDTRGTVPNVPMYLTANLALAKAFPDKPGWAGRIEESQVFPFYMDIAYIKAYQFKDAPKVASPPLSIGIPFLSSPTVKAGDDLTITTNMRTGAADLEYIDAKLDIAKFDGSGNYLHNEQKSPQKIRAHSFYPYKVHFKVPDNMPPGVYSVHISGEWPGGKTETNLATEFTVIE